MSSPEPCTFYLHVFFSLAHSLRCGLSTRPPLGSILLPVARGTDLTATATPSKYRRPGLFQASAAEAVKPVPAFWALDALGLPGPFDLQVRGAMSFPSLRCLLVCEASTTDPPAETAFALQHKGGGSMPTGLLRPFPAGSVTRDGSS